VERPDDRLAAGLRFPTELVAWVATPWALAGFSWVLAVLSVVVLIGVPTVFTTPGDKTHGVVAVPGLVTILIVSLQIAAAVISAWWVWPVWASVLVSVLAAATLITEQPRWRWLLTRTATG
jgi:hypothetical protein